MRVRDTASGNQIDLRVDSDSSDNQTQTADTSLDVDTFYHIAFVHDASTSRVDVFLNGVYEDGLNYGRI